MNKHLFKRELWETQMWLMLILAFLMIHFGGCTSHVLGWVLIGYSVLTFIGALAVGVKYARVEENE